MADQNDQNDGNQTPPPGSEDLPQWAREAISKANNEAASFRTQLRAKTDELTAALDKLSTASTEMETIKANAAAVEANHLKLSVALAAGIPGEQAAGFADRLRGENEAELKADAEELKKAFGGTFETHAATDPTQGRGSDTNTKPQTPADELAAFLQGSFSSSRD